MRLPETQLDYRTRKHFNYKANLSDNGSALISFFKFIDCLEMWLLDKISLSVKVSFNFKILCCTGISFQAKIRTPWNCYILDSFMYVILKYKANKGIVVVVVVVAARRPNLYSFHVFSLLIRYHVLLSGSWDTINAFQVIVFNDKNLAWKWLPTGNLACLFGCLGGRFIISRNVGKNPQILRNPQKFAFWPYLGVSKTPYLGNDVMILYLQLRGSKLGWSRLQLFVFCSRGPNRWASFNTIFLDLKGLLVIWFAS